MRSVIGSSCVCAVAALVMLATAARADDKEKKEPPAKKEPAVEKNVAFDKVPKVVQDAVKARFPEFEVSSVEKETTAKGVVYDIELKVKGRKCEMDIKEDGTVLEVELEIPIKDLPEAARKTLENDHPKVEFVKIMGVHLVKDKTEKLDHYEVVFITAEKKEKELLFSLDGKIIKKKAGEE